jgi:hypothetical protein
MMQELKYGRNNVSQIRNKQKILGRGSGRIKLRRGRRVGNLEVQPAVRGVN